MSDKNKASPVEEFITDVLGVIFAAGFVSVSVVFRFLRKLFGAKEIRGSEAPLPPKNDPGKEMKPENPVESEPVSTPAGDAAQAARNIEMTPYSESRAVFLHGHPFRFKLWKDLQIVRRWVGLGPVDVELTPLTAATASGFLAAGWLKQVPEEMTLELAQAATLTQLTQIYQRAIAAGSLMDRSVQQPITATEMESRFLVRPQDTGSIAQNVAQKRSPAPSVTLIKKPDTLPLVATEPVQVASVRPMNGKPLKEVSGQLLLAGEREFPGDEGKGSYRCFAVEIQKENGDTVTWRGVHLHEAVANAGAEVGNAVSVTMFGKRSVQIYDEKLGKNRQAHMNVYEVRVLNNK